MKRVVIDMAGGWLELSGQVCVVTGALGGLGAQICREFASNGAQVAAVDIDEGRLDDFAFGLEETHGVNAQGYAYDVSDEKGIDELAAHVVSDFGRVDVLVNTAAVLQHAPLEDLSLDEWEHTLKVNLTGYFLTSQRFGRIMLQGRGGRMVHMSSQAATIPDTFAGAYSSSKAGVNALSKMIATEWGPYGIRSNTVCPTYVKTGVSASAFADPVVEEERERLLATRDVGDVSDVTNAVMFLASARSGLITGHELAVDAGFSAMMNDLTPLPGGRRAFAHARHRERGFESWSALNLGR